MIEEGGEGLWSFCCLDIIGNEKDCFVLVKSNLKAKNQKLHGMAKKREKVFATAFFKGRERERGTESGFWGPRSIFEFLFLYETNSRTVLWILLKWVSAVLLAWLWKWLLHEAIISCSLSFALTFTFFDYTVYTHHQIWGVGHGMYLDIMAPTYGMRNMRYNSLTGYF